ncbi:MAG: translation elongation factor Ts [Candidatus Liberibacter ctenarytainae]|uniref:Elongation factor Ts n=1 Tax=Candidatus Liberibacter ctenarytainae TaxID=2020335 RepID=A0A937DLR6_9HYPH|nr:translation elongation factor Ts [Candidatus Liberibacter ctenarytainae]
MSEVSAIKVKELREKTGAGIMDCRRALIESKGDGEMAIDILQIKGGLKAKKQAGKEVLEGLIGISRSDHRKAAMVEVNIETDILAYNSSFQKLVSGIAHVSLSSGNLGDKNSILSMPFDDSGTIVKDTIEAHIAIIGENIKLSRSAILSVSEGVVSSYIHAAVAEGLGKIGVILALKSSGDKEKLSSIGEQIAMHVAASSPLAISMQTLDHSVITKQRDYYMEEMRNSGKSENMIEKIVGGKMQKFFKEVVLLSQDFVVDPSKTVFEFLKESEKDIGSPIEITGMLCFVLGDRSKKI